MKFCDKAVTAGLGGWGDGEGTEMGKELDRR